MGRSKIKVDTFRSDYGDPRYGTYRENVLFVRATRGFISYFCPVFIESETAIEDAKLMVTEMARKAK